MSGTSGVTGREWVHLTSAAVQTVADVAGIPILHVKGPAAEITLDIARQYSDVDVLVHPKNWQRFLNALEVVGFKVADEAPLVSLGHSLDVISPVWGASVDVHHRFPGIEIPAGRAFDQLWARRVVTEIAGRPCPSLDHVAHALIIGLHAARSPAPSPKWTEADTVWSQLSESQRDELARLARDLGAEKALGARWEAFTEHTSPEDHRLWEALSRRDAETVWWMRFRAAPTVLAKAELIRQTVPRYVFVMRRRHGGDPVGILREVAEKGCRVLRAARRVWLP